MPEPQSCGPSRPFLRLFDLGSRQFWEPTQVDLFALGSHQFWEPTHVDLFDLGSHQFWGSTQGHGCWQLIVYVNRDDQVVEAVEATNSDGSPRTSEQMSLARERLFKRSRAKDEHIGGASWLFSYANGTCEFQKDDDKDAKSFEATNSDGSPRTNEQVTLAQERIMRRALNTLTEDERIGGASWLFDYVSGICVFYEDNDDDLYT